MARRGLCGHVLEHAAVVGAYGPLEVVLGLADLVVEVRLEVLDLALHLAHLARELLQPVELVEFVELRQRPPQVVDHLRGLLVALLVHAVHAGALAEDGG